MLTAGFWVAIVPNKPCYAFNSRTSSSGIMLVLQQWLIFARYGFGLMCAWYTYSKLSLMTYFPWWVGNADQSETVGRLRQEDHRSCQDPTSASAGICSTLSRQPCAMPCWLPRSLSIVRFRKVYAESPTLPVMGVVSTLQPGSRNGDIFLVSASIQYLNVGLRVANVYQNYLPVLSWTSAIGPQIWS